MFVLSQKLRNLKKDLKFWNINVFENVHLKVKLAKENVDTIQKCSSDFGPNHEFNEQEERTQSELFEALMIEEVFWNEKARINWFAQGDRSTSFFHKVTKIRHATESISMLKNGDATISRHDDIDNHFVIPSLVTDDENNDLTRIPSNEEISEVVFALNSERAPSPDGFGGCVDIVEEFRPITLTTIQFKIITKVLADRLALIVPRIISKQQRGFIKDRRIQDCICLASEAINLLDYKTFGGNLAIKFDIIKAFDTID
ncbi:PREDICTED: uncharacterized protein LOC109337489 [Lupinus angustifolius]|uniref:uncharacterized protein LOC109337489 n=1 Tax=Lupinus angustifolius TaxID=3871 RepID=UPI00092F52B9|nr:PREDICTED: uncharacterized protein LOC109337489 [Lupinus angustifolius]